MGVELALTYLYRQIKNWSYFKLNRYYRGMNHSRSPKTARGWAGELIFYVAIMRIFSIMIYYVEVHKEGEDLNLPATSSAVFRCARSLI